MGKGGMLYFEHELPSPSCPAQALILVSQLVVWLEEALEPSGVRPLLEELSHRGGSEGSRNIFSAFCSAVR